MMPIIFTLRNISTPIAVDYSALQTLIFNSELSSLPSEFTVGSAFSFTGGKLQSSGTGGVTNISYHSKMSVGDRQAMSIDFTLNSATSNFALCKFNTNAWSAFGSIAELNFASGLIILRKKFTYPTLPDQLASESITIAVNNSDSYRLYYEKNNDRHRIRLTNLTTNQYNELTDSFYDRGLTDNAGLMRGFPGIMHLSGDVLFSNFKVWLNAPIAAKYVIIGDSYVDGYSIAALSAASIDDRWTWQLYNHVNYRASMSGWGGITSTDLLTMQSEILDPFTPENVIIMVGLNEANFSTWQTNINTLISAIEAKGATPILCTLPPITTKDLTFIGLANTWILSTGYTILDIAKALTTSGDRVNIDSSKMLVDDAHPNVSGNDAIYNEFLLIE